MLRLLPRIPNTFPKLCGLRELIVKPARLVALRNLGLIRSSVYLGHQNRCNNKSFTIFYSSFSGPAHFNEVCEETLDSLAEYLEELVENTPEFKNGDVSYSDGVITACLGGNWGTYVINRQTPNQQIWLSSPTSGPKRYDFENGVWIYKHDNSTLHSLLDSELSALVGSPVDFTKRCSFGKR